MEFTPAPANDFAEYIATYYERCRQRVPEIEAIAGKWSFADLIPGLSDFDARFLVNDSMSVDGWCRMSSELGKLHYELALERPHWMRNLEHLPGINLKWSELVDRDYYSTELQQWSFFHGDAMLLEAARSYLDTHIWNEVDEHFHWKRIATYYGRYDRAIDPPVNTGPYAAKYRLHSRLMHYFAPPVHAAVSLVGRNTNPGKMAALNQALTLFPQRATMELVLKLIGLHYEAELYLTEPGITRLDNALATYLQGVVNTLREAGAPFNFPPTPTPQTLKTTVLGPDSTVALSTLFDSLKYARLLKGRLWFYGQELPGFDTTFLIRNELNRMQSLYYDIPLRGFAQLVYGEETTSDGALLAMRGDAFSSDEIDSFRRFAAAVDPICANADLKQRALEIAAVFDEFLFALNHLVVVAKARLAKLS